MQNTKPNHQRPDSGRSHSSNSGRGLIQATKKQLEGKARFFTLAVLGALVVTSVESALAQKTYQIYSIAETFGDSVNGLAAIADNGTFLGNVQASAVLMTRNSIQPLDAPPGPFDPTSAFFNCLNASLTTAGSIYLEDDSDSVAFIRQPDGTFQFLSFPPGSFPSPTGINDQGDVVGSYYDQDGVGQGFIADQTGVQRIDIPGGTSVSPLGINASGVVVGNYSDENYDTHNFIMDSKGVTDWTLPGASFAYANCINNHGAIGGYYGDGTKVHAFVFQGGKLSTIDYVRQDLPDTLTLNWGGKDVVYVRSISYPQVISINDRGDIVGYTFDLYKPADSTINFAFVYEQSFWGTPLP